MARTECAMNLRSFTPPLRSNLAEKNATASCSVFLNWTEREMKLLSGEEREDANCSSLGEPSHVGGHPQLPILPNTARESKCDNNKPDFGGSQTARIRFAPPPRPKQKIKYSGRVSPRALICEPPTDLHEKQLNTANCFTTLETWQRTMEAGALKNLLVDIQEVLNDAIYGQVESGQGEKSEYFSLVAEMQNKFKLQKQERKRLTTKLAMENAIEQDLTTQLQLLERELAQLHTRHAHNRSEIEGERKAVQILERDYALLTDQEQELLRDCEVLELQLDNQRAQLKEIRSQQLYLDFVSSAPLKRHLEEKKWQEQHASVALQVQNADAENRAIEDEIRRLEEEAASLEDQYTRDMLSKQQSEIALREIQAKYEQFQEVFERARVCYTPRPDWDRIVDGTPELSVQKYQWEGVDSTGSRGASAIDSGDKGGVLERLDSTNNVAARGEERAQNKDRTKTLVKEMLHWIERLQKHCGVNLHLSRIWHDVEEARVELNILHHQLDRVVRKTSMHPIVLPNMSGVITITAATSSTSGSPTKRKQDYIMALGMYEAVPLFLRHRGKLKRRTLKKIDVEKVVRKVWVEKRKREQRNPLGRFPLEQVLYEKLHRKYGFQPLIAEWGYNLLLALQTFSWDSEIEMFLLCLTGAVSDLVYVDQEQMIQGCQRLLLRLCELYNVESFVTERRVLLKDALVALRTFFPLKTSAQLQAIEQAIIRDMHKMKRGGNDSILYVDDILPLDVKYPLGFFVKTIRTQHFKEIQDYYALLLSELEQRDTEQQGILPLAAVRDAITAIDPLADAMEVQSLVMKALRIKTRLHLHLREPVLYKAVLRKMNATCLMKFALNFDQNAEVNWRRRPGVVYIDTSTLGITPSKKD